MNDSYSKNLKAAKEWNKNNSKQMSDNYIKKLLKRQGIEDPDEEMINVKRTLLILKRLICVNNQK